MGSGFEAPEGALVRERSARRGAAKHTRRDRAAQSSAVRFARRWSRPGFPTFGHAAGLSAPAQQPECFDYIAEAEG